MIDLKDKAEVETVAKYSLVLAAVDLTLAAICAILGNDLFVPFMFLAGMMWAYGKWLKSKMDSTGE